MTQAACRRITAHHDFGCPRLTIFILAIMPVFVRVGRVGATSTTGGDHLRLLLTNHEDRIVLAEVESIYPINLLRELNVSLPTSDWVRGDLTASRIVPLITSEQDDYIQAVDYDCHHEVLFWSVNSDRDFIRFFNRSSCATAQRPGCMILPSKTTDDDFDEDEDDYADDERRRRAVADQQHDRRRGSKHRSRQPNAGRKSSKIMAAANSGGLAYNDPLTPGNADGMAFDWIGNNMYWSDSELKRIEVVSLKHSESADLASLNAGNTDNLDRKFRRQHWRYTSPKDQPPNVLRSRKILFTNLDLPFALTVAPSLGWLFWSERGQKTIRRGAMNGGSHIVIADRTDQLSLTSDDLPGITLAFDHIDSRLYWAVADSVSVCNVDGSQRQVVAVTPSIQALAVFAQHLFWTSLNRSDTVMMSDKTDGKEKAVIHLAPRSPSVSSGFSRPNIYADVRVLSTYAQPIAYDPCENANCSGLCLVVPLPTTTSVVSRSSAPKFITSECACPTGISLQPDGRTCYSSPRHMLILARLSDVRILSLDAGTSSSFEPLPLPTFMRRGLSSQRAINSVAFDKSATNIYWSESKLIQLVMLNNASRKLLPRATLEATTVVSSEIDAPEALALDWKARNLYWTDVNTGRIEMISIRRDLPNSKTQNDAYAAARRILVAGSDLEQPRGIAVDPESGYLFWADWGKRHIARSNLDGTAIAVVAHQSVAFCNNVAVDRRGQRVYWVDGFYNTVEVANYDGSQRRVLVAAEGKSPIVSIPFGLAILGDYVYWSNHAGSAALVRANRHTGGDATVVMGDYPDVFGIAAVDMTSDDDSIDSDAGVAPKISNPCTEKNNFSGCQQFCMFMPHSVMPRNRPTNYYCACGAGFQLDPRDGKSCITPEASLMLSTASGIWLVPTLSSPSSLELVVRADRNASEGMSAILYEPYENSTYWISTFRRGSMNDNNNDIRYEIRRAFGNSSRNDLALAQTVVDFGPSGRCEDISIDYIAGNLYWTDVELDQIEVARLDGSLRRIILWERIINPASIAVDSVNGHIYWTQFGVDPTRGRVLPSSNGDTKAFEYTFLPQIRQAGLDGSEPRTLFPGIRATSLVIDYESQQIYWFNADAGTIENYPLRAVPGTEPQVIVGSTTAKDIAVYHGWLYWISNNGIERVNRTDNATRSTVSLDSFLPQLLAADSSSTSPPTNEILSNNTRNLPKLPRNMPIQAVVRSMLLFPDTTGSKRIAGTTANASSPAAAVMSSPGWNLCARRADLLCPKSVGLCFAPANKFQQNPQYYKCKCQSHYALRSLPTTVAGARTSVVCKPPDEFLLYSTANNEIGRYLIMSAQGYEYDVPNVRLPIRIDAASANGSFERSKYSAVSALEFDARDRMIYWINKHSRTISRADENGHLQQVFVASEKWRQENMPTVHVQHAENARRTPLHAGQRPRPISTTRNHRLRRHVSDSTVDSYLKRRLIRSADSLREDFLVRASKAAAAAAAAATPPPSAQTYVDTGNSNNKADEIQPFDMTIDPYSRHLIWSCALHGRINVTHLDSGTALGSILDGSESSLLQLFVSESSFVAVRPRWLALHWHERVLYFVNAATNCIESVVLDGSGRQQLVCGGGAAKLRHLVVDQTAPALYWIDGPAANQPAEYVLKRMRLPAAPFNGRMTNSDQKNSPQNEMKIERIAAFPKSAGISAFSSGAGTSANSVYWAAVDSQSTEQNAAISYMLISEQIASVGSSQRILAVQSSPVLSGGRLPSGSAGWLTSLTGVSASSYYVDKKHPCNELRCSHFCVLGFERRAQCACPVGMELSTNPTVSSTLQLYRSRHSNNNANAEDSQTVFANSNVMPSIRELTSVCVPRAGCDFMCPLSVAGAERKCISRDKLCDWHRDCPDGSDEYKCNACQLGGFRCASSSSRADSPDSSCVLQHSPCGGDDTTSSSSAKNEALSALFNQQSKTALDGNTNGRNAGEQHKSFGERVWLVMQACPNSYWTNGRCDDRRDCDDGSDELDCSFNETQKFYPVADTDLLSSLNNSSVVIRTNEQNGSTISAVAEPPSYTLVFVLACVVAALLAAGFIWVCITCCRRRRKKSHATMHSNMMIAAATNSGTDNTSPLIDQNHCSKQHQPVDATHPMLVTSQAAAMLPQSSTTNANVAPSLSAAPSHSRILPTTIAGAVVAQQRDGRLAIAEAGTNLPPSDPDEHIYTASVVGPAQAAGKQIRMPSPPPASSAVAAHSRVEKHSALAQAMLQQQRQLNQQHSSTVENRSPMLSAAAAAVSAATLPPFSSAVVAVPATSTPTNITSPVMSPVQLLPNGGFYVPPDCAMQFVAAAVASAVASSTAAGSSCLTPTNLIAARTPPNMFRPPNANPAGGMPQPLGSMQSQHRAASLSPAATAGNQSSPSSTATPVGSSNAFAGNSQQFNYFQQLQQRQQLQQLHQQQEAVSNNTLSNNLMSRDSRTRQSQHSSRTANHNNFAVSSALPPLPSRPPLYAAAAGVRPVQHHHQQHFCDPGGGSRPQFFNAQQQHTSTASSFPVNHHQQQQQQPYYPAAASPFCDDSQRSSSFAIATGSGSSESHYANLTPTPSSAVPFQFAQQHYYNGPASDMPSAFSSSASSYHSGGDTPRHHDFHGNTEHAGVTDGEQAEPIYENANYLLNSNQLNAQRLTPLRRATPSVDADYLASVPAAADRPVVMPLHHNTISREEAANFHQQLRSPVTSSFNFVRPASENTNDDDDKIIRYRSSNKYDERNSSSDDDNEDAEDDDSVFLAKLLVEPHIGRADHQQHAGSLMHDDESKRVPNHSNVLQRSPVQSPLRDENDGEAVLAYSDGHDPSESDLLLSNGDMPPLHCGGDTFAKMTESQFDSDDDEDDDKDF